VSLVAALAGIVGVVYSMYGPFNLLRGTEPPLAAEEWDYVDAAGKGIKDGIALLKHISETPHTRDRFEGPEYENLRSRVADDLRALMEAEPSERFRTIHSNVLSFLENSQESAALMSRFSYSLDQDTFNRAAESSAEAARAMGRATAELNKLRKRLNQQRPGDGASRGGDSAPEP
jgi:hypothetical protein